MSTRANWHLRDLQLPTEDDPFEDFEASADVIDLTAPREELEAHLSELVRREGVLFNSGITCAIKDRPDTTCHACPLFTTDPNEARFGLCKVGREQERTCTALAVEASQGASDAVLQGAA